MFNRMRSAERTPKAVPGLTVQAAEPISRLQKIALSCLRDWFPSETIIVDHRPDWLRGLELDLHLPRLSCAVEVDGHQHRYWMPEFHETLELFQEQVRRDSLKRQICELYNVKLCQVLGYHNALQVLAGDFSAWLMKPFTVSLFIQRQWSKHLRHLTKLYSGRVAFLVKDGKLTPRNPASKRFLTARTQSDNRVPCNSPPGSSGGHCEGQAPGGQSALPGSNPPRSTGTAGIAPR